MLKYLFPLLLLASCSPEMAMADSPASQQKVFQSTAPLVCSDREYIEDGLKNHGLQPAIRGIVQGDEWMFTLWVNDNTHQWAETVLNKDGKTECIGAMGGNIISVPMAKQQEADSGS